MQETLVTILIVAFLSLISVVASVISYQNARKPLSSELMEDVNSLAAAVEKILKEQRKEKMRNVRAAGTIENSSPAVNQTGNIPAPITVVRRKEELRKILMSKGKV